MLNKLNEVVKKPYNLEEMLDKCIGILVEDIGAVSGGAYLIERGNFLQLRGASNLPEEFIERINDEAERPPIHLLVMDYTEVRFFDLNSWRELDKTPYAILNKLDINGFINVALISSEKVLGFIHLYTEELREVDKLLSDLYMFIGNFLGIAVDNKRLSRDIERRKYENSSLCETSTLLISTLEYDTLFERVLWIMTEDLRAQYCAVILVDPINKRYRIKTSLGYTDDNLKDAEETADRGIIGWVARLGLPINVPNVFKDNRYVTVNEKVRSELAVPMIADGKVIGVLNAESDKFYHFSDEDLRFLTILAHQVACAIERSKLHQKLQEQAVTDRLTGLHNRQFFEDFLRTEAKSVIARNENVGIIMIDLNNLKEINDTYGHTAGDYIIIKTAEYLKQIFEEELIIRWGGDEFTVFLTGRQLAKIDKLMKDVKNKKKKWVRKNKIIYPLEFAIGYATAENEEELKNFIDIADKRMYRDKRKDH
ncbi:diguanylate cyclase [bacterium]|nr:diguanylate cyclase [bacterium]